MRDLLTQRVTEAERSLPAATSGTNARPGLNRTALSSDRSGKEEPSTPGRSEARHLSEGDSVHGDETADGHRVSPEADSLGSGVTLAVGEQTATFPAARPRRTGSPAPDSASEPGPGGGSSERLCFALDEHVPFVTLARSLAEAGLRIVNDGRGGLVVREAS